MPSFPCRRPWIIKFSQCSAAIKEQHGARKNGGYGEYEKTRAEDCIWMREVYGEHTTLQWLPEDIGDLMNVKAPVNLVLCKE